MPLWVVIVGYILLIGGVADGKAVYAKPLADVLEANLNPLVGGKVIARLSKQDTSPANDPQVPAQYRKG